MRARAAWLALAAACIAAGASAACVDAPVTQCTDWLCPGDQVCAPSGGACVRPDQLAACDGAADGQACSYPGTPVGACFAGVCKPVGCGNSELEPGEACDDGNTLSADGCSSDCRSDETCGNGTVDVAIGELCDDGNTTDGDGCQADCALPGCGDGVVDIGEACDDGNRESGDGCNALCSSDESCGNGGRSGSREA